MQQTKHYDPDMGTSEEVVTEDGTHKYWREAVPLPLYTGLLVKRYQCSCGRKFPGKDSYELHYRKAYAEEKHLHENRPENERKPDPSQEDIGDNYMHTNSKGVTYYLNMKPVQLRGGKYVDIYYFSKDYRADVATALPKGYKIRENPRNGFLTVSKPDQQEHDPGHVG